jgi:hypothetical protein
MNSPHLVAERVIRLLNGSSTMAIPAELDHGPRRCQDLPHPYPSRLLRRITASTSPSTLGRPYFSAKTAMRAARSGRASKPCHRMACVAL